MKVMRKVGKDYIIYQDDFYAKRKIAKDRAMDRMGWVIIAGSLGALLLKAPQAFELFQKVFYLK